MNGESHTNNAESGNCVSAENSWNDGNTRNIFKNELPLEDETEITKDQSKNEENISDGSTKNESLNSDVHRSNNLEMNAMEISSHTAILEQLQQRIMELGSDQDSKIISMLQKLNQEHRREIENIRRESNDNLERDVRQATEEEPEVTTICFGIKDVQ